jgi:beta-glucosidase
MNPARLVFPALRWSGRSVDEVWPEVRSTVELGVGGFVVFGGGVTAMQKLVTQANEHAGRPLLFAADLERGAGQQLAEATPLPPAAALSNLDDQALFEAARLTAQEAASAGISWILGPVADLDVEPANPIIGTRSFGSGVLAVADQVRSWVKAAQAEGVIACAKHFPGHGRTTVDSHQELPVVDVNRQELEHDITAFRAAIEAGVQSIMMAHVAYPTIDPSGKPASLSPEIIGLLREELGFRGLIVTDAMIMEAVSAVGLTPTQATVEAVRAGCDAVLYPSSAEATVVALNEALHDGTLTDDRVGSAVRRIEIVAESVPFVGDDLIPAPSHERALEMAAASVMQVRGTFPELRPAQKVNLQVVDDDAVAIEAAPFAGPTGASPDRGVLERALEQRDVAVNDSESGGAGGDLVALFSEVRGWKGRSGLAASTIDEVTRGLDRSFDATLILFGHPRLADQLPAAANVICAWNGDPLMQEAVAARLVGSLDR